MINKIVLILLYFLLVLVYILSIIFAKEDHFALNFPIEKNGIFSEFTEKGLEMVFDSHGRPVRS